MLREDAVDARPGVSLEIQEVLVDGGRADINLKGVLLCREKAFPNSACN
jgi:hypothetical protein